MEKFSIYKITLIDKYYYYGQAIEPTTRFDRHLKALKNASHHNIIMQRIWNKYKDINFEILESNLTKEEADVREKNLIENEECINIAKGGDGGDTISNNPNRATIVKKQSINHCRNFSEEWKNSQGKISDRGEVVWGNYTCIKCNRDIKGKGNFLRYHGELGENCGAEVDSIICPHCGKIGKRPGPMKNKHFDNCNKKVIKHE